VNGGGLWCEAPAGGGRATRDETGGWGVTSERKKCVYREILSSQN
jgi:hypothetical protein